jgi:uncharacterized protein with FMN-binding domain
MNIVPKRGIIGGALTVAALALILSFKTPDTTGLTGGGNQQNNGGGNTTTGQQGSGSGTGSGTGAGATYSGQVTGSAVQIPFGVVQVQVTLQNGKITDVQTLQMPSGGRTSMISQYAAPQLRSEVLSAQSSQVDTISGATYTSEGYLQSLQSALDQVPA